MQAEGRLTTHVLDTAGGRPGAGLRLSLFRLQDGRADPVGSFRTNADGRCDAPLLAGDALRRGQYELVFHVGEWRDGAPGFYDDIPVRFRVDDAGAHHHVPLILSPFGYATYRGS